MNIVEFYSDLRNIVGLRAAVENDYKSAAFMGEVAERLAEAGEIENLEVLHFEGAGAKKRRLLIDGYDLDDSDGSVALAVLSFSDSEDLSVLAATEIKRSFAGLENFLRESADGSFAVDREESSPAVQLAEQIRHRGANVTRYRLYLITDAQMSGRAKSLPSTDLNGIRVDYHIWDIQRLFQVFQSIKGREELEIDLREWMPGGLPALEIVGDSSDFATYLAALPGDLIADLYSRYGSRLLESNVRSYLSARGKVNKGIKSTVLTEPEMFLAYNNGITATATGISCEKLGGQFVLTSITDLQIVNGGQTTASLFHVRREISSHSDLSNVHVQMKLVVVDPEKSVDLVPNISRYANSQNKVSETDFFSNSPFHVRMEEISRRVLAPASPGVNFQTKWFYERTRGQYVNETAKLSRSEARKFEAEFPRSQVITKTDAAKYEVSWGMRPHIVSAGSQKNFVAFADTIAQKWTLSDSTFNEVYFRDLVAKAILYGSVRKLVARADWYDKGYLANIVAYTLAKLAYEVGHQGRGKVLDFGAIWNCQSISQDLADGCLSIAESVFRSLTDPSRPIQNVTEWAKKEACWDSIKKLDIPLSRSLMAELISSEKHDAVRRDAQSAQKIDNGIQAQVEVINRGHLFWLNLIEFGKSRRLLTPKEVGILGVAAGRKGGVPSERQSIQALDILSRAKMNGFPG